MEQTSNSQFFTLRVWPDMDEEGNVHWRGKLRHIPSETIFYFRDWAELIPQLLSILRQYPPTDADTKINKELNQ